MQNVTWTRLWLSTDFTLELGKCIYETNFGWKKFKKVVKFLTIFWDVLWPRSDHLILVMLYNPGSK